MIKIFQEDRSVQNGRHRMIAKQFRKKNSFWNDLTWVMIQRESFRIKIVRFYLLAFVIVIIL